MGRISVEDPVHEESLIPFVNATTHYALLLCHKPINNFPCAECIISLMLQSIYLATQLIISAATAEKK